VNFRAVNLLNGSWFHLPAHAQILGASLATAAEKTDKLFTK